MRSQDEIVQRIEERSPGDPFGFEVDDYILALDAERAAKFLKEGAADEWVPEYPDDAAVLKAMKDYVPFAWEKANGCRGISAYRSLQHFGAWFWLLGNDEMTELCAGEYEHYGKDILVKVTEALGLNPSDYDDGRRVNSELE